MYNFTTTPYEELTQADKKRYHKLQLKDQLADIQSAMKSILAAREELKKNVAKYEKSQDQFSQEYIYKLIEREKEIANTAHLTNYNKAARALDRARQAVDANHSITDLGDERLVNAISIIRSIGTGIKYDAAQQVINEFVGDQTSLKLLQGVFTAMGATLDGGLNKMIYDPEVEFARAGDAIRDHLLNQEGSLNYAARAVAVIATGEGCEFPTVFDPTEIDRATRRAAGLPIAG